MNDDLKTISVPDDEDAIDRLKKLLIGHTLKKIDDDKLITDNGYILEFEGNDGCGGCCSGNYYIEKLDGCNNLITNVELKETCLDNDTEYRYEIFVYTENDKIQILQCDGNDGNGWYGSGYWIYIKGVGSND